MLLAHYHHRSFDPFLFSFISFIQLFSFISFPYLYFFPPLEATILMCTFKMHSWKMCTFYLPVFLSYINGYASFLIFLCPLSIVWGSIHISLHTSWQWLLTAASCFCRDALHTFISPYLQLPTTANDSAVSFSARVSSCVRRSLGCAHRSNCFSMHRLS